MFLIFYLHFSVVVVLVALFHFLKSCQSQSSALTLRWALVSRGWLMFCFHFHFLVFTFLNLVVRTQP